MIERTFFQSKRFSTIPAFSYFDDCEFFPIKTFFQSKRFSTIPVFSYFDDCELPTCKHSQSTFKFK